MSGILFREHCISEITFPLRISGHNNVQLRVANYLSSITFPLATKTASYLKYPSGEVDLKPEDWTFFSASSLLLAWIKFLRVPS